jgi:hypothetical protein
MFAVNPPDNGVSKKLARAAVEIAGRNKHELSERPQNITVAEPMALARAQDMPRLAARPAGAPPTGLHEA